VRKTVIRTSKTNFYFGIITLISLLAALCKIISEEILATLHILKLMDVIVIEANILVKLLHT
jgi:hypothetical protein